MQFSPLGDTLRLASMLHKIVGSLVPGLLFLSNPSTVRGPTLCNAFLAMTTRVMPIIVFTINTVLLSWPCSHVLKERCKRTRPSRAHSYSTTAIIAISIYVRIATTLNHATPNAVFRCVRKAMRPHQIASNFLSQTPARSRVPIPKRVKTIFLHHPTLTPTFNTSLNLLTRTPR